MCRSALRNRHHAWMDDDSEQGRTDLERRFLETFRNVLGHAPIDIWDDYEQLVVTVTIVDPDERLVLRTLRVDYDGRAIWGGNDPDHQIDPALDPDDPEYFRVEAVTPERAAEVAADFFRRESCRPIDRLEWDGPDRRQFHWVLADVGLPLVGKKPGLTGRTPDRTIRLPSLLL